MVKLPAGKVVLSKDEDEDSDVDMDILVALVFGLVMGSNQRKTLTKPRLSAG